MFHPLTGKSREKTSISLAKNEQDLASTSDLPVYLREGVNPVFFEQQSRNHSRLGLLTVRPADSERKFFSTV